MQRMGSWKSPYPTMRFTLTPDCIVSTNIKNDAGENIRLPIDNTFSLDEARQLFAYYLRDCLNVSLR